MEEEIKKYKGLEEVTRETAKFKYALANKFAKIPRVVLNRRYKKLKEVLTFKLFVP